MAQAHKPGSKSHKRSSKAPTGGFRRRERAARYGLSEVAVDRAWRAGQLPEPIYIGKVPFWPAARVEAFEATK